MQYINVMCAKTLGHPDSTLYSICSKHYDDRGKLLSCMRWFLHPHIRLLGKQKNLILIVKAYAWKVAASGFLEVYQILE